MFSKASVIYSALILNTLLLGQTRSTSFYTNMMRNIQRVSESERSSNNHSSVVSKQNLSKQTETYSNFQAQAPFLDVAESRLSDNNLPGLETFFESKKVSKEDNFEAIIRRGVSKEEKKEKTSQKRVPSNKSPKIFGYKSPKQNSARGRTFDIPNGGKRSKLSLRKQFKTTLGPSGIKSANREMEENKNRIPLLLTEVKKNNTGEERGGKRKIGPTRHENSISNISNSKSLYDWYQYLKKSGRFRFNVWPIYH